MRLLLAIFLGFWAVVYVILGVPALVFGEDDLTRPTVGALTRAKSLEPMTLVEIEDGVLVLADDPSLHFVGGDAFVPLVTADDATVIAGLPGFDLAAARAENGTRRVVLLEMSGGTFRKAVRDAGTSPTDRIVGPFATKGLYQEIEDRSDAFREVADRLGLDALEVVAVEHSPRERGRFHGAVSLGLALACGLGARALLRSRRRIRVARAAREAAFRDVLEPIRRSKLDPSAPPPTPAEQAAFDAALAATPKGIELPSFSGAVLAKVGVAVAFVGLMLAKVSDTALRGTDDLLSARSARNVDALPPGSSARAGSTVDEAVVAERVAKTIDAAKKITDAHKYWKTFFGAHETVQAVLVLDELEERYESAGGGWWDLVAFRQSLAARLGRNGEPQPVVSKVIDDLPDRSRGETTRVSVESPGLRRAGSVLFDSRTLTDSGKWTTSSVRAEVEVVEGSWAAFRRGQPIRLRYTPDGMRAMQAELERVLEEMLEDQLPVETFRRTHARVETSARVAQNSNVTIVATSETVTITSEGPTVIELALGAWR